MLQSRSFTVNQCCVCLWIKPIVHIASMINHCQSMLRLPVELLLLDVKICSIWFLSKHRCLQFCIYLWINLSVNVARQITHCQSMLSLPIGQMPLDSKIQKNVSFSSLKQKQKHICLLFYRYLWLKLFVHIPNQITHCQCSVCLWDKCLLLGNHKISTHSNSSQSLDVCGSIDICS